MGSEMCIRDRPEPVPASSDGPAENWPEPEVPEEASEQTEEGVEAALQHWFETRQYARNTGDTAPLEAASTENCALCSQQVERVEEAYENGWYVQDEDVVHQTFLSLEGENLASGLFTLNQGAYAGYWDGDLVGEVEALEERPWTVALAYVGDRWLVADLLFAGDAEDEEQL